MKVKARLDKFHVVNPNGVKCDIVSFDKLKKGETVDLKSEVAQELLQMAVVTQIKTTKKKES